MSNCTFNLGRWQDQEWPAAAALITDPPYSARVHKGSQSHGSKYGQLAAGLEYGSITQDDAQSLADRFCQLAQDWAVIFCDHVGYSWHAAAWSAVGWYVFAPVAWVKPNAPPRFQGDGPQSAVEYLMIARPKRRPKRIGSRPGYYLAPVPGSDPHKTRGAGHKSPLALRHLVDNYTDPGDLVLDPYGGTATMGSAAIGAGRSYQGSEVDPEMHRAGLERLRCVPSVLPGLELRGTQADLF